MRPLLTLLMLALAGCATGASLENCVCPLPTVPPLSLPHVQRVATLDPVLQGIPARPGPGLQGIAAYPLNPAAPSGAHAPLRALLSIEGMLYALDLTAHSVQVVPTPGFVCRTPALSPDARFLACVSDFSPTATGTACSPPCTGNFALAALSADWPPAVSVQQRLVTSPDSLNRPYSSLSWSPDGRHLAVAESTPASDLTFLALTGGTTPDAMPLAPTGYVRVRGVRDPEVQQLAWSPDGSSLALLLAPDEGTMQVALISLAALPAAVLSDTTHPTTVDVTPQLLMTTTSNAVWMAWSPDGRSLTLLDDTRLEQVAVPSGVLGAPLLAFPANRLVASPGPFAWLGDGRSLLFSYGPHEMVRTVPSSDPGALALIRPQSQESCACVPEPPVFYEYTAS